MCGICGVIARTDLGKTLDSVVEKVSHRGPDGRGALRRRDFDWNIFFGHRRLSIIDLAGGAQPMSDPALGVHLTFNGEIFNFLELRAELSSRGETFRTRSDSEVLLKLIGNALQKTGANALEDALKQINGMFALGVWDEQSASLVLARDRIGIKPLYYAELKDGGMAFASELTALLELPELFDTSLNAQGISDFFFHDYIPAPETIIRGIRKLGLGEYLLWRPGKTPKIARYWSPHDVPVSAQSGLKTNQKSNQKSEEELAQDLLEHLRTAVSRQMIADVPVGVFLSGGIDSSLLTALAVRESESKLKTFSIGFSDRSFDESAQSRGLSKVLGTDHSEEILSETSLLEDVDQVLGQLDEPLGDVSILPTSRVSRLASRSVKVCLGGDGGDELWAGYPFYRAHQFAETYGHVPRFVRNSLIKPIVDRIPVGDNYQPLDWKLKLFVNRWESQVLPRHLRWLASTDIPELPELIGGKVPLPSYLRQIRDAGSSASALDLETLLRFDLVSYLPGSVLAKLDRATMANGVEARPPFLDNDVIDFSLRQPSHLKLRRGVSKYLLKKTAKGFLSKEVLGRPKRGFSVPISKWARGKLRPRIQDTLISSPLFSEKVLSRAGFGRVFDEHVRYQRHGGKTLWSMLVLDSWVQKNKSKIRISL